MTSITPSTIPLAETLFLTDMLAPVSSSSSFNKTNCIGASTTCEAFPVKTFISVSVKAIPSLAIWQ